MIAPVRAIQLIVDREMAELQLRSRFGILWPLIHLQLLIHVHKTGHGYVQCAEEILKEWPAMEPRPFAPYDMNQEFPYPEPEEPK
jgi:hypothetical protein